MVRGRDLNMGAGSTAIVGADEFARKLKKMDSELYKQFGDANRQIAKTVVGTVRSDATSYSRQAAKAARSARATSARNGVSIALGGARWPYALGAEYGSLKYPQFPPWRGNQWTPEHWGEGNSTAGYWFHPALDQSREYVLDSYMGSVEKAADRAGIVLGSGGPRKANLYDIAMQVQ